MQISIANVIQVARRIGAAAAGVITTNLKMWLGFETSETLGTELVVNGDFATDSDWTKRNGSTINDVANVIANGNIESSGANWSLESITNVFEPSKTYQIKFKAKQVSLAGSNAGAFQVGNSFGALFNEVITSEFVDYTLIAQSSSNNWPKLTIGGQIAGDVFQIDDISVKKLTQFTPDKSGNNNVGELFTGKALEFDGNLDSVTFSSFPTSIKSVVFWYKPLASQTYDPIIWLGGIQRGTIAISNNLGTINCTNLLGKVIYVNGVQTESVTLNQWQRVVINFPSKTLLGLGFAKVGINYGDCQLSDVQFYNENLTTDDIAYDYANPQNLVTDRSGSSIDLADLRGYWALSEGAGSIVYDSSGGNHNGTISGAEWELAQPRIPQLGMMNFSNGAVATGVTLIPDPNNTSQDIEGNLVRDRLNSLNLDGTGYAEVADSTSINPTDAVTVECWVYWTNTVIGKGLVAKWSNFQGYMLLKQSATKFDFYINSQNKRCVTDLSNGWNHIVGTYDEANMKVYLNGGLDVTLPHTSEISNSANPLEIGRYDNNSAFSYSERISDARIYNRALSATEVLRNYNAGLSAHTN